MHRKDSSIFFTFIDNVIAFIIVKINYILIDTMTSEFSRWLNKRAICTILCISVQPGQKQNI